MASGPVPATVLCPLLLATKAATNKMLQIIEVRPKWSVHADVFEHPSHWLVSRRPIWSDMTPVDISAQWREDWLSASVVNHTTVTDRTIRQTVSTSFVTHGHCLTVSGQVRARIVPTSCTNGVLQLQWPAADHEPCCRHMSIDKI